MPGAPVHVSDLLIAVHHSTTPPLPCCFRYSYIVGSVWVHSFSTAHSYSPGTEQRAWIEADLAAAAEALAAGSVSYIFVVMHYPPYCSHSYVDCGVPASWLRYNLEPLWYAHNVSLVLYGHIHAAEVGA